MLVLLIGGALLLDLMLGDPRRLPHPVVLMGKLISCLENLVRRILTPGKIYYFAGMFIVLLTVGTSYGVTAGIIYFMQQINPYLGLALELILLYTTLAAKGLQQHAMAVKAPLERGELEEARGQLAKIVGRDTEHLSPPELVRGTVETVAENTVDGITAPLFYAFLGGAPLAMAYKAVNTLDSMLGYRDDRYRQLGWAAARLDDVANYLPARITGFIFLLISPFTPGGFKRTWHTIKRDAPKHPSPNSGIPEAAVAGALKIQLGGVNYYRGKKSFRALMGDNILALKCEHIDQSIKLMYAVTLLALLLGGVLSFAIRGA